VKVHLHRLDAQAGTGQLGAHAQGDPFVGLDTDDEDILVEPLAGAVEEDTRDALEGHGDLGAPLGIRLAVRMKKGTPAQRQLSMFT